MCKQKRKICQIMAWKICQEKAALHKARRQTPSQTDEKENKSSQTPTNKKLWKRHTFSSTSNWSYHITLELNCSSATHQSSWTQRSASSSCMPSSTTAPSLKLKLRLPSTTMQASHMRDLMRSLAQHQNTSTISIAELDKQIYFFLFFISGWPQISPDSSGLSSFSTRMVKKHWLRTRDFRSLWPTHRFLNSFGGHAEERQPILNGRCAVCEAADTRPHVHAQFK